MANFQNSVSGYVSRRHNFDYTQWFLELSRRIDDYVAHRQIPRRYGKLPSFIKRVCRYKWNNQQQSALLAVMVSVQRACHMGWFSTADSAELINLAYEIASKCNIDLNNVPSRTSLSVISAIMSRFFPRLALDYYYCVLEVKSGYQFFGHHFQIPDDYRFSPEHKIRLFVVRTDNMETSSCLVTPADVNFLFNSMEVKGRNTLVLASEQQLPADLTPLLICGSYYRLKADSGPQLPTDLTPLCRYGANVLHAAGNFEGNYIVAVALMRELPNPESASLQYYEHSPATLDADSEMTVGPSEISLNCPISFGRIKTPVKGRSCKHISCFDFDNYMEINSRRPHWRCPGCNKHACYSDIRLDGNMAKVLREVNPNVSTITVNTDGTWAPVIETEDTVQTLDSTIPVVDLTEDDDDPMDAVPAHEADQARIFNGVSANNQMIPPPVHHWGSDVASTSQTQAVGYDHRRWIPEQMCGSLSGQEYNDYYHRTITVPMQQPEAVTFDRPQSIAGGVVLRNPPPPNDDFFTGASTNLPAHPRGSSECKFRR